MEKRPFLILMASQKGGVGKTTIALNLAVALTYQKYKVLLVDGDVGSASLSEQLGISIGGGSFLDVLEGDKKLEDILYSYQPINLDILPSGPAKEMPVYKIDKLAAVYSQLKRMDYDFIIVDAPPGLFAKDVAKYFNDVLILSTPDAVSSSANARMAAYCEKYRLEHRLVINRVGMSKFDLDKDSVEKLFGDIAFQMVPEDRIVPESIAKHKPAYILDESSDFSAAIEEIAREYALKIGNDEDDEPREKYNVRHRSTFFEKLWKFFSSSSRGELD